MNISREKIIELILGNPNITIEEMAESIGISSKGIEYNIDKLKKDGILLRIDPDKGGYWEIAYTE